MTVYNKTISKVMDNNKTGYTQLAAVVIFVACASTKHTGVEKKKKKEILSNISKLPIHKY